ncbi:MAG: 6-phosphogluconolactonase [Candidatus Levybacteria bacterium]|nr:6-phosphogluconolactonase [Candidatus Levybacteria bacterium]
MEKVLVENSKVGIEVAKERLYKIVDRKTVLFLSGGSTPKTLYEILSKEGKIKPGAVAMVDERYGEPFHPQSNDKMIKETGFVQYLKNQNIAFYPILQKDKSQEQTSNDYDENVRYLLTFFPKSAAILGIGKDGHTAGIAPNRKDFTNLIFQQKNLFVSEFSDSKNMEEGGFGKRITITFDALSKIDFLIILAFGENKKKALGLMFKDGSIEEVPARFFTRPEISSKTLLITDQKV